MNIIDTNVFPMNHQQFVSWYKRYGGPEFFEVKEAIELDHQAALAMEAAKQYLAQRLNDAALREFIESHPIDTKIPVALNDAAERSNSVID